VAPRRPTPATIAKRRERVADLVRSLPEAIVEGEQHLGFTVRGRRFGWLLQDHHGDGRLALHCKAAPGINRALAEAYPDRFHVPPYVGGKGWLGLWLDLATIDWDEVAGVMRDAYRLVATKRLGDALDRGSTP